MRYALVIMIRNEIEGITHLFDRIPLDKFDEVVAIDGMSNDNSVEFLENKGIRVIVQTINGRGQAFRDAFNNTSSDVLVFFGPDGNENPDDIVRFIEDCKKIKPRKWVNIIFNIAANILWNSNKKVYDTINGFRAIARSTWDVINIDADGYTVEYQTVS